jgi:hypothetical protein
MQSSVENIGWIPMIFRLPKRMDEGALKFSNELPTRQVEIRVPGNVSDPATAMQFQYGKECP